MDTSGSELQELRRLVGELTARVFRLEQCTELAARVAATGVPPSRPRLRPRRQAPPYPIVADIPPLPPQVPSGKDRAARTWNPASVRTG